MDKILVSACLLGKNVRYDGGHQKVNSQYLARWQAQGRIVSVCPEVEGGLGIPRIPAEICGTSHVKNRAGQDVTTAFEQGAMQALSLCLKYQIKYALLKESSPSCGRNYIYDGSFSNRKIPGLGITSRYLLAHGIAVFSEAQIDQLVEIIDG
ncbi:DUF523 domain-containing protein [Thalassotalea ganghwensis]